MVSVKMLRTLAQESSDCAAALINYQPHNNNTNAINNNNNNALVGKEQDIDIGPIFLSWANRSTPTNNLVKSLTNFTVAEFCLLWMEVQHNVLTVWNVGSGCCLEVHPMDAFLMAVAQMKAGSTFDNTARAFGCRTNMFWRIFESFVDKCGAEIFNTLCLYKTMGEYCKRKVAFAGHPDAIKTIDVAFQKAYAQGEDFASKKIRFSGKHKAYGIKTEIAVGPDGKARFVGAGYPGSFHNMKIFCSHLSQHLNCLRKDHADITDFDDLTLDNPDECYMWAAMMDRGYKGACQYGRFLSPKKKSARTELDANDLFRNNKLEQDRVIVENYFGRMKQLWGQMEKTFCLRNLLYPPIMKLAAALTNFYITMMPLRKEDGQAKVNYYRRLLDNYNVTDNKRKQQQKNSRMVRIARLNVTAVTHGLAGDLSSVTAADLPTANGNENDE